MHIKIQFQVITNQALTMTKSDTSFKCLIIRQMNKKTFQAQANIIYFHKLCRKTSWPFFPEQGCRKVPAVSFWRHPDCFGPWWRPTSRIGLEQFYPAASVCCSMTSSAFCLPLLLLWSATTTWCRCRGRTCTCGRT